MKRKSRTSGNAAVLSFKELSYAGGIKDLLGVSPLFEETPVFKVVIDTSSMRIEQI